MKILSYPTFEEMSRAVANLIVKQITQKPASLICIPSGDSPLGVFKCLIADAKEGKVNFDYCTFVGLDEWVGLGDGDDGSCTTFLYDHFFTLANIGSDKIVLFNARSNNLDNECEKMNNFLAANGPLDIMMVGIGMNGHIGLNEPGTDSNLYAHYAPLAKSTITVGQKYFKQQTELHDGITLGLKNLQEAGIPLLIASGPNKAAIIATSLKGEITENVPASIFQKLPSAIIFLDEAAAFAL